MSELYNDLMALANDPDTGFFYTDQDFSSQYTGTVRMFNHRLTGGSVWLRPNALFGRGTTFLLKDDTVTLLSLCMPKFFNLGENDFAVKPADLTPENINQVDVKHDGSLITVFRLPPDIAPLENDITVPDTDFAVKSKGSFYSTQAEAAKQYLANNLQLVEDLQQGYSRNFEWTAPDNRIVVWYNEAELKVLNDVDPTGKIIPKIAKDQALIDIVSSPESLHNYVETSTGDEGFVVHLNDGRACKIKNNWYLTLHHALDNFSSVSKLAQCVFAESIDDLKSAFPEQIVYLTTIEDYVIKMYNNANAVLNDWMKNRAPTYLTRKDIAIAAKRELSELEYVGPILFSMAMAKLDNKDMTRMEERLQSVICEAAQQNITMPQSGMSS